MKFEVNRKMLPMKGHYFFFNAGTAPVVPFMPTLARQLGFSTIVVGTVYTILPIIGLLVKPLFGFIADRFQIRKTLFIACQLLTAVAFLGIKFITPVDQAASLQLHCNDGIADLRYCPPDRLDGCAVAQLTADQPAADAATMMTCTMRCSTMGVNSSDAWQPMGLCDRNAASCEFDMTAHVKMNHIEHVGDCLMFLLTKGVILHDNHPLTCPHRNTTPAHQFLRAHCDAHCSDERVMHTITNSRVEDSNAWALPQFWAFFACLVFSWAGMAAVVSLGDAICFHMLGDKPHLYGNQRLWGGVGWGIFSLLAGLLVDEMSRGQLLKDYSGVFYMMVVLMAADLAFSGQMDHSHAPASSSVLRDIGVLFLSPAVCVFFVWCVCIGLGTALIWNFLFWHLENLADADETCRTGDDWMKTLQGLAMGIQCFAGEIPFFFLSGAVLKRIGHVHAMSMVLLAFGVRFLLYSVLTNPWWVLPIETMQGVTFGIFYATMTSYASIVAPPGTESTLQGLVGAVFEGIGVAAGSFIGGYMIESLGGSVTFRLFGAAALVLFVVHVVVQKLMESCACTKSGGDNDDDDGGKVVVVDGETTAMSASTVVEGVAQSDGDSHGGDGMKA